MRDVIINALKAKYDGQIQEALCNVEIYLHNPAGIGEHPEILEAINAQLSKMTEAQEKKEILNIFE
jgi:hypothetical protein